MNTAPSSKSLKDLPTNTSCVKKPKHYLKNMSLLAIPESWVVEGLIAFLNQLIPTPL